MIFSTETPLPKVIKSVPIEHSIPSSKFIGEVISEHFQLPEMRSCRFFYEGSNDIFKVETSQQIYYARLARHGKRTRAHIDSEIAILQELSKKIPRISTPLRNSDSNATLSLAMPEGTRYLNLFTEAKGSTARNLSLNNLEEIGRTLGSIHSESNSLPTQESLPVFDLDTCLSQAAFRICKFLREDNEIRRHSFFFQSLAIKLKKLLGPLDLSTLSWGIIHGDFITCNIHLDTKGSVSVFDFDRIGYGWRAYEVGAFLGHLASYSAKVEKRIKFSQITGSFLKGYESKAEFSELEKSLIPLFHIMRRLWILGICCERYEDWSHSFLNTKNWDTEVAKLKKWVTEFQIFKI